MWRVLSCLTTEHDLRLVLVAGLVCLTASFTSFRLYGRVGEARGGAWLAWVVFTGFAAGSGTWATHFIAMLAYHPPFRTGYLPFGTAASLVIAIVSAAAGYAVADFGRRRRGVGYVVLGGVIVGAGVAMMHYAGMSAFRTEGDIRWSLGLVTASVVASLALPPVALYAAGTSSGLRRQLIAGVLLTLGICALHFIAMGAVTLVPDPTVAVPPKLLSDAILAGLLVGLVGLILMAALGTVVIDAATRRSGMDVLNQAIGSVGEGLAFFDRDERLVAWNDKYFEFTPECRDLARTGVLFEQLLTRALECGAYPDAAGREMAWLEERRQAWRESGRLLLQRSCGDRWYRIEERRTGEGIVSVIVDVTELKRDAEALARARDAADAANRAKSVFLTNMSHELRTPLNGISGLAHALAVSPLEPPQAEMVGQIRASAAKLERLVSDLLDLARVERGKLELARRRFHVAETVRAAAALVQTPARAKGLDLVTAIGAEAEAWVEGDDLKLTQILSNLLSNAVKFTERGSIVLSVERAGQGRFEFVVTDTGVGFDPAQTERLFQSFEQSDDSLTRSFGGGGVGLSISRQLARALGGDVTADSTPGHGSTFRLALPLEPKPKAGLEEVEPAVARIAPKSGRLRTLIVDDHPLNRQVLELMLKASPMEVTTAENGLQACELYEADGFDLVLMDMQMPVMDGLSAVSRLRAFEAASGRPPAVVIMVTANALPEHYEASRAAGADDLVAKPVNPKALFGAIDQAFNGHDGRAAA